MTEVQLFQPSRRQSFRRYFQPSRIVLGVFNDIDQDRVNVITLCFNMYCSYKPPMMAFSIWRGAYTYSLLDRASECVLSVPGRALAEPTLFCGLKSGEAIDKASACGVKFVPSERVGVPGIAQSIANIELRIVNKVPTGDHMTVVGEVLKFGVDKAKDQTCLVSVGPDHEGYTVLASHGIHRIGIVTPSDGDS